MKMIKMALLGGAALAVTSVGAKADDLEALKAQIEALNTRVAAMETAPSVPAGYQLIAVSEGELQQTPGLGFTARERAAYGNQATIISVLPTADAPAGTTISWSGYARAGLVYSSKDETLKVETRETNAGAWVNDPASAEADDDDIDVFARGQIRVKAATDTAVGEVGTDIRIRGNFDGVSSKGADFTMDVAWGYWAMTPELTFGGGYAGTLGNIGYGMDGACTCHYIDTLGFDPGDTTQMRLSYASGPFSMAIALEDGSLKGGVLGEASNDRLGASGEIKYSGDTFSGEISGMWRDLDEDDDAVAAAAKDFIPESWWQVGAGTGFSLGDIASLSLAAAMGEGPVVVIDETGLSNDLKFPWNNSYWGVSGLASFNLNDEIRAEIGAGYREREFDDVTSVGADYSADSEYWIVGGGVYYSPVDQLTIGIEASYSETSASVDRDYATASATTKDLQASYDEEKMVVDLVSVWRF
jgi:hypothetical protein